MTKYRHDKGRNCGTCDYWQPDDHPDHQDEGNCHLHPPKVFLASDDWGGIVSKFPKTHQSDWCGKYKPNDED